jgi:hypothetical protein
MFFLWERLSSREIARSMIAAIKPLPQKKSNFFGSRFTFNLEWRCAP